MRGGSGTRQPFGSNWAEATAGLDQDRARFYAALSASSFWRSPKAYSMGQPNAMGIFTKSQPKPAALPEFIPEPAPTPDHAQEEDALAALNDAHRDLAAELEKLRAKHASPAKQHKAKAKASKTTALKSTESPPAVLSRNRSAPSFTMGFAPASKQVNLDPRASYDSSIHAATLRSTPRAFISATPRFKPDRANIPGPGTHSPRSTQTARATAAYSFGPTPARRTDAARNELKRRLNAAVVVNVEAVSIDVS